MKVRELPIDDRLKRKLIAQNIEELYPPQAEAIEKNLLNESNMVIAVPTASGKTLIAILAIFSTLLRNPGSKAVYLAPLRALASEKFEEFSELAENLGLKVAISTGDLDENSGWLGGSDIIIATNEKFDSLIRHQVGWLNDIKVVVSDEVHLINDGHRGPVLEVVLSLIRRNLPSCQIVALSATIINADEIADWLEAELILSNWRPVELREAVWCNGKNTYSNGEIKPAGSERDDTGYISLSLETIDDDGQALIFANTRRSSMASAEFVGDKLSSKLNFETREKLANLTNEIRSSGEKTQLRERLADAVKNGAAFHHAGLASVHRKLIEEGFKDKIIQVIAATPTLAAGVNLPGRRVIIRSVSRYSPDFGYTPIPVLEYKQMAGRAGRPRYDDYGEAIIVAKNKDEVYHYLDRFVRAETEEIYSKLGTEPAMRSHILAFIASNYVDDFDSAMEMVAITFYGYQHDGSMFLVEEEVWKVFELLTEAKLISPSEPYEITPFGRRVSELYLDPLSARMIKLGLEDGLDRETIPNIAYLQLVANTPDIRSYSVRQKDMGKLIDLADRYDDDWLAYDEDNLTEFDHEIFLATLKVAYVIELWLSEASEEEIYRETGFSSGDLHSTLERTKWLIHCAAEIAKIFKWKKHRNNLLHIDKRLKYGVNDELLSLVSIAGIGRIRARTLFDSGYTSKDKILKSTISQIAELPGFGEKMAKKVKASIQGKHVHELDEDIVVANQSSNEQQTLKEFFD